MTSKAVWVCPKLCGCKIEMTADWLDEPILENGIFVSYRHPKPFTISEMNIISICSDHSPVISSPIDSNPYGYTDSERISIASANGLSDSTDFEHITNLGPRGYFRITDPLNVSNAEKLYMHLWRFSGGTFKPDTCGCVLYKMFNRILGIEEFKSHPKLTKRCKHHLLDESDDKCLNENKSKNKSIFVFVSYCNDLLILDESGNKIPDLKKINFYFDKNRKLLFDINQDMDLSTKQKISSSISSEGISNVEVSVKGQKI